MHNHAPENYQCPICLAVEGVENDSTWIKQTDIFYRDELVMGFISSKMMKGNEGNLVPRFTGDHFSTELWQAQKSNPDGRIDYAQALRIGLANN